MEAEDLRLVEPGEEWETAFRAMMADFRAAGERRFQDSPELARGDFAAYVSRQREAALECNLSPGYVPSTTYWLVRNGRDIVGGSALRHYLTPGLINEGGHIGYAIRPSERRRGYGTWILTLTLEKARARGLMRVLVTCDTDNIGSARIIRKNGGQFEDERTSHFTGKRVSRYWIDL